MDSSELELQKLSQDIWVEIRQIGTSVAIMVTNVPCSTRDLYLVLPMEQSCASHGYMALGLLLDFGIYYWTWGLRN